MFDFNGIVEEKLDELETDFNQNRQNYPQLYIITPYDDGKSIFTKTGPKKEVLSRIAELAGECYNIVCSTISDGRVLNVFVSNYIEILLILVIKLIPPMLKYVTCFNYFEPKIKISDQAYKPFFQPLFKPNLDGYNIIIYLNHSLNARRNESPELMVKTVENLEEYDPSKTIEIPIADFNPVDLYLKELRVGLLNYFLCA